MMSICPCFSFTCRTELLSRLKLSLGHLEEGTRTSGPSAGSSNHIHIDPSSIIIKLGSGPAECQCLVMTGTSLPLAYPHPYPQVAADVPVCVCLVIRFASMSSLMGLWWGRFLPKLCVGQGGACIGLTHTVLNAFPCWRGDTLGPAVSKGCYTFN